MDLTRIARIARMHKSGHHQECPADCNPSYIGTERVGAGIVRDQLRTRENGALPCGTCHKCGSETYQCADGSWLHWSTLTGACPTRPTQPVGRVGLRPPVGAVGADDGLSSLSGGQEGAIS